MATTTNALIQILCQAQTRQDPAIGVDGPQTATVENAIGGQRWTDGIASGQVDRAYVRIRTVAAGATDSYNLLAAGALKDLLGQTIDADELKGIAIKVTSGSVEWRAPAANGIALFTVASEGLLLSAGHCAGVSFGAAGLSLGANALFDVVEIGGVTTATYELWFIVAQ